MRTEKHSKRRIHFPIYSLLLLVLASVTILIASKNSPLYLFNDWVDLNAFMTMGKGWLNGLIPYRDLFEQKGPVLYFIFAIANAISKTYFGIFLIEVLFFFATLFMVNKIARRYLPLRESFLVCSLMSWILTMSPYFTGGGSVEELSYVFILYSIDLVLELSDNNFKITNKQAFLSGLFFSVLFWIKYTMVGSYLAAFIILFGLYLYRRQVYTLLSMTLFSLLGFMTITVPVLVYFWLQNALDDLKFCYFTSNISLYPSNPSATLIWKIINAITLYINKYTNNPLLLFIFIFMLIYLIVSKRILQTDLTKFLYCAIYFGLILTTLYGGRTSNYYFLILFPFAILPVISLIYFMEQKSNSKGSFGLMLAFSFIMMIGSNNNLLNSKLYPDNPTYTLNGKYQEPFQIAFSRIINDTKNPSLLNYGFLDYGLYHQANVLPSNRYFEKQNISNEALPEMMAEQNEIVAKKRVTFVILRTGSDISEEKGVPKNIRSNYTLVAEQQQQIMTDRIYTYRLYQLKN